MSVVFSSQRGIVNRVPSSKPVVPFLATIDGDNFTKAIITQAAITQNENYQFLHTLADTIYAYVFGTRIGELTVSGVAFAGMCNMSDDGLAEILQRYNAKRISQNADSVRVVFGSTGFDCFLTGMNASLTDPENLLTQWTYRFSVFPG